MKVTVVGGGFAGMSAAVELSRRGAAVILLEGRQRLGGRAYSFRDQVTGTVVDNGQHLLMRCCTATLQLLDHLGSSNCVTFQDRLDLTFCDESGWTRLRASRLPGRLGLLMGLIRFGAIPWHEALAVPRITNSLGRMPGHGESVAAWLVAAKQPPALVERFWTPLCVSVMNQRPGEASARLLAAVLREALSGSAGGVHMGWATSGLGDWHDPVQTYLASRDGRVKLGTVIRAIEPGNIHTTVTKSGDRIDSDAIVVAVPPPSLRRLITENDFPHLAKRVAQFVPSPIVSVNIWTGSAILTQPFLGFVDAPFDWIFRRDLLHVDTQTEGGYHTSLIASAADEIVGKSNSEIYQLALETMADARLPIDENDVRHFSVIREPRATYALPLGVPPIEQRTGADGIVLAGDWTDTGFPCTIEGAIRSGRIAADIVLGESNSPDSKL